MTGLIIAVVPYLIGSIPSGFLVAKTQGLDIREHGSRNIGATNVLRVMGKKWGYLVFFCDSFKGFAAVKLGSLIAAQFLLRPVLGSVIAAVACILGHTIRLPCFDFRRGGFALCCFFHDAQERSRFLGLIRLLSAYWNTCGVAASFQYSAPPRRHRIKIWQKIMIEVEFRVT